MTEEGKWVTINGAHVFVKEGQSPMDAFIREKSELSKIKTQKGKMAYLSDKYKDKLRYPITAIKVKKFATGDRKTGKYDWQYYARTKSNQDIYVMNSLEELDEKLAKAIYK